MVVKDDSVLLVKITYGANKDHWMLPGGLVEEGETFQEAAVREVKEETGLTTKPKRLIGVRDGIRHHQDGVEHGIYFVFEMDITSGELDADGSEVSDVQFIPIDKALLDTKVIGLTKEMLRLFRTGSNRAGLFLLEKSIQTNNQWSNYEVFRLANALS
ncbi:NUDIX domain-containing protein [Paenibacillus sp. GCM10027626]|uniref:NUDIX domain-containing protein n=1 Tax=Paenibacillus sp. GCM10027626 TaxID=3273411 RepID=UPI003642D0C9